MPTLVPLLEAPWAVQLHVVAAIGAIVLLPWTLFRRSRDRVHRFSGYVWVTFMATAALSSFFIAGVGGFGPFSAIHLISIYALFGLWQAVRAAIRRDVETHRTAMTGLTIGALGVAGLLSLMPGRRMNTVFFGDYGTPGFFLSLTIALVIVGVILTRRKERAA